MVDPPPSTDSSLPATTGAPLWAKVFGVVTLVVVVLFAVVMLSGGGGGHGPGRHTGSEGGVGGDEPRSEATGHVPPAGGQRP